VRIPLPIAAAGPPPQALPERVNNWPLLRFAITVPQAGQGQGPKTMSYEARDLWADLLAFSERPWAQMSERVSAQWMQFPGKETIDDAPAVGPY
jgi:hypothetical protein